MVKRAPADGLLRSLPSSPALLPVFGEKGAFNESNLVYILLEQYWCFIDLNGIVNPIHFVKTKT